MQLCKRPDYIINDHPNGANVPGVAGNRKRRSTSLKRMYPKLVNYSSNPLATMFSPSLFVTEDILSPFQVASSVGD